MSYKPQDTYSGTTQDILLVISEAAKEIKVNDLSEIAVDFSISKERISIRIKS